jgi:hypothetical protein
MYPITMIGLPGRSQKTLPIEYEKNIRIAEET